MGQLLESAVLVASLEYRSTATCRASAVLVESSAVGVVTILLMFTYAPVLVLIERVRSWLRALTIVCGNF